MNDPTPPRNGKGFVIPVQTGIQAFIIARFIGANGQSPELAGMSRNAPGGATTLLPLKIFQKIVTWVIDKF
ncbi:MAG: hypothetical protein A2509_08550 [Candidatus Edwardsbacteria bacterium RIFOXYD12_FULL_50_11]|uniref:Uncharacterized protein n=1 Tax=Candidatus Edwardsbacteria bacterium GWF2_54_11 TaxID=1817851 RepID=A0A1F5REP2_9BACT|nr:MAG: hypothetical protein A2502_01920 [Candidatus Edwardsbacteria bacterium RifOxyC12_full_54_24]OGF09022.1 MAG: hypothetical protein A2273_10375 [Candidatus Edwardsbacteria bacterium RifOxyA12_full_54_48]OGF12452.1 MAG: hypothetical protein A3K15_01220 [Candidatus Edwardsbacteria bacterium GWE2_54_12]OGF12909.1 MAG: hypothetical protein A2024_11830 [Candidatus Edwardsbacteria bacterium GWF2_54_11]OGF17444.1 MAG: hypothetical protein A2509_08550 [Candidatus Edwardsbacteria bacterium RIFOXYD1